MMKGNILAVQNNKFICNRVTLKVLFERIMNDLSIYAFK